MNNNSKELQKQADEILERAKETGLESNFFFTTTFNRYLSQIRIVERLESELDNSNIILKKSYVKGTENAYINPAITAYNNTTAGANKTVTTLIKILDSFEPEDDYKNDPLMELLNGYEE
jgi:hypothetical protein